MRQCAVCRALVQGGARRCRACLRAASGPSPLREWRERTGTSLEQLARQSRVAESTVHRVAAGRPASGPVAMRLSDATGLDVVVFLRGARWT